ncbi:hypothetical protein GCM10007941_07220 [Amphritea balenae]|nr:hypothetical protein GCM10007941_07220 [Amphritea balenae]
MLVLMSVLIGACTPAHKKQFPQSQPLIELAGVLLFQGQQLWYQPCNERYWWPVADYSSGNEIMSVYQRLTSGESVELYAELTGSIDPAQNNVLAVKALKVVGGTKDTCNFRLEGLEFRAASSSPYWVADVASEMTIVKSINPLGKYTFFTEQLSVDLRNEPQLEIEMSDEKSSENSFEQDSFQQNPVQKKTVYRERTPVKQPLEISITPGRCIDDVNGSILAYSVEMLFFGQTYRGCARKGHSSSELISGLYWLQDNPESQQLLKLKSDKKVQLVRRAHTGKTLIERGTWQYLESGKLILSMRNQQQKEFVMLFRRELDNSLTLLTSSVDHLVKGRQFRRWHNAGLVGGRQLGVSTDRKGTLLTGTDSIKAAVSINSGASQKTGASEGTESSVNQQPSVSQGAALVINSSLIESVSHIKVPVVLDFQAKPANIDEQLLNEIMVSE